MFHRNVSTILVSVASFIFMCSCTNGPRDNYDVHIDASFTAEEQEYIVRGLEEWENSTGHNAKFPSVDIVDHNSAWTDPDSLNHSLDADLWFVKANHLGKTVSGCPNGTRLSNNMDGNLSVHYNVGGLSTNHVICIDTENFVDQYDSLFYNSVLHETGHALGVDFPDEKDTTHYSGTLPSVMKPGIPEDASHVQCIDIVGFCTGNPNDCTMSEKDCYTEI